MVIIFFPGSLIFSNAPYKRRRFAAARRSGDENHAMRLENHAR